MFIIYVHVEIFGMHFVMHSIRLFYKKDYIIIDEKFAHGLSLT